MDTKMNKHPLQDFVDALEKSTYPWHPDTKPRKTRIEYAECPMTGTLEEMVIDVESGHVCPVVREYEKHKT
jgi:predicted alpha/beta-hydrolase family hydrolase